MAKIIPIIPVYITNELHMEYTEATVNSIVATDNEVTQPVIVVNHCNASQSNRLQSMQADFVQTKENGVSIGWNQGIRFAQMHYPDADYYLVMNNDIVLHPKAIDNLVKFAQEKPDWLMWTANTHDSQRTIKTAPVDNFGFDEHPHFSCFMIAPRTIDALKHVEGGTGEPYPGYFDENFKPAYFEDADYHQRILRAGCIAGKTATAMFYHAGSRTIKCDEELDNANRRSYEDNRDYIHNKWGIDFHGTAIENTDPRRFKYKVPFEGKK